MCKNTVYCLDQILAAAAAVHQTAPVQQTVSHLTNHSSKMDKTCWALMMKQGQTHKRHPFMDSCTWKCQYLADQQRLSYINSVQKQDLTQKTCQMDDLDGWWDNVRELSVVSVIWW